MKPRLTNRVIRGLIHCTSEILAGTMDGYSTAEQREIADADQWLRRMREWRDESKKHVEDTRNRRTA